MGYPNTDNQGVTNGSCPTNINGCKTNSDCMPQYICLNKNCVYRPIGPIPCMIDCIKGYHCINNKCIPNISPLPTTSTTLSLPDLLHQNISTAIKACIFDSHCGPQEKC
jgi:hypothetical protein